MLDAYAIRKAIPRIVIAVIAINLSIYLCVAALDITNVVAKGMTQLITAPFDTSNVTMFSVKTDPSNAVTAGVGVLVGAGPMYSAIIGLGGAATGGALATIYSALTAAFWLVLPVLLIVLAILATVIIRQALLFFLIVTSPIAIAMFILPGTEKYFRKWLDLFAKALLVYPIIAVLFAMSDIFGSIIFKNNDGGVVGIATIITGIAVIIAPLFLIPFAFRFAGGALGAIVGAATGVGDRMSKSGFVKGRQEYYGQKYQDQKTRNQALRYRKNKAVADNEQHTRGQRRRAEWRMSKLSGYRDDIYQREAAMNERLAKEQEMQKNFGDDTDRRAYGIDRKGAQADFNAGNRTIARTANGGRIETSANNKMRQHFDAAGNLTRTEYSSLGGSWQTDAAINRSEARFGQRNTGQLQQTLTYEMTKAIEEGKQDQLIQNYGDLMKAWNMSGGEGNGTWIGPAFNNQQEDLMYKHTKFDDNGTATVDHAAYTREVYEKKGPQMLAYLKGKNIKELRRAHAGAVNRLNAAPVGTNEYTAAQTELKMHEAIMDTLSSSQPTAVGTGAPGAPGAPTPQAGQQQVPPPQGGPQRAGAAGYGWTTGSGHTTDELKQYFDEVKNVAQQRAQFTGGNPPNDHPLTNPYREDMATTPTVESQAAEANPDINRERL